MTFYLNDVDTVRIEVLETPYGTFIGFRLPDEVPDNAKVKFNNRSLHHMCFASIRMIVLDDFVMRALDWKEGDELCWKVYSDRTDFFKRTIL